VGTQSPQVFVLVVVAEAAECCLVAYDTTMRLGGRRESADSGGERSPNAKSGVAVRPDVLAISLIAIGSDWDVRLYMKSSTLQISRLAREHLVAGSAV
jgi:hypothetical protein